MSGKVKAADAEFGEWFVYEFTTPMRVRCASDASDDEGFRLFVASKSDWKRIADHVELTHLPGCTGWDWEPPPGTSLAASFDREEMRLMHMKDCEEVRDRYRILEAARRVDALEAALDAIRITKRENDSQFYRLRMWCLDKTGCDTNNIIGKPGFPDNLVDCVIDCMEAGDREIAHNDHDDVGESEHGKKYQERTKTTEKPKRREWWFNGSIFGHPYTSHEKAASCNDGVLHVREVLPGDPSPDWVDELVRLCSNPYLDPLKHIDNIERHLAKRGKK